ncbi:beta-alanine-activating enzyme isoform X2 [Pygocentrus nattereri]|uniref:beta-alanine-activating enzyme isoform X2 n=1 Tax=Pygocentrus nattereri TaxID=42514 RepID=UPI001891AF14|nr:beta-alanine-activating enzyme isoform X2 [Pygocentrus nattereri]
MSQRLHDLVHEAARVHGDKIAAVFDTGDAARTCLTYEELVAFVNELVKKLSVSAAKDERAVGVFCHADLFLPVWIISVLQLPAAYVPLDPVSPPLLTLRIMERCNLRFCLIQSSLLNQFQSVFSGLLSMDVCATWSTYNLTLIKMQRKLISSEGSDGTQTVEDQILQNEQEAKQHHSASVPIGTHQGEQLAYVLHTSGTTGLPKIVKVPHKCIVPNIIHLRSLFKMTTEDVVFLASPLTFDPSVVEMFLALTSGACLLMVPSAVKRMPGRLARVLFKQNSTTVLQATPTLMRRFGIQILQEEVLSAGSSLRVLALGGEAFPSLPLLRSWRQDGNKTCIYNLYGTTEVSCWACCYDLPNSHRPSDYITDASVPLGEPLMDTAIEVRDNEGHLVTEGEGQIFIGGQERVCLLDNERFTAKGTMRATGDWVLVRDSHLYYLGRKDNLIKRHGQRVHIDALQQECLGLADDAVVAEDAHFMLSGGDSLQALRLFDYITVTMGTASPGLLEVLLDGSFSDVLKHLTTTTRCNITQSAKRPHEDSGSVGPSKRYHIEEASSVIAENVIAPVVSSLKGTMGFVVVRRAGQVLEWDYSQSREESRQTETNGNKNRTINEKHLRTESSSSSVSKASEADQNNSSVRAKDVYPLKQADIFHVNRDSPPGEEHNHHAYQGNGDTSQSGTTVDGQPLSLKVLWSSDTGRCVDASPVLLVRPDRTTVFIGSHSHRLQALDLTSGEVFWERVLGDRLESSAAVSKCGTLVAVGSYDGQVYFLHVDSGETWWAFETGDAVKSSPTVDPQTGLFVIGSHDGHVYALESLTKRCVWKHHCENGAVFSSPIAHSSPRQLYAATLGGQLHCLCPDSGKLLWKYSSDVPFFSSPSCSDSCVCIGSVNGDISALSHDGRVLWHFRTAGPVFSSPCLARVPPTTTRKTGCGAYDHSESPSQAVVCGSHDCFVYGLNIFDGSLLWRFQTTGKVYSSPFVFDGTTWDIRTLVVVASTDGTVWVLDGEQGTLKASLSLPGQLFSSPVVWGNKIVVGCRNDYVYCLELSDN